jgi:uncharacterized protein YkwD
MVALVNALAVLPLIAQPQNAQYPQSSSGGPDLRAAAEQLFALANQSRAQTGAGPLQWDPALAEAALRHCRRMAMEGPISHRYGGELDVAGRAAQAGAHFSLIEENIAVGSYATQIHDGWMHSPGHRTNLLNPRVDHVGIAVVAAQGVFFAVADYEQAVPVLTPAQVEGKVASLIKMSGVPVRQETRDARAACRLDHGLPPTTDGEPNFVMRWQGADLDHLPQELVDRLGTRDYRQAEVGSCPAQSAEGSFTVYRLAVLLYSAPPSRSTSW